MSFEDILEEVGSFGLYQRVLCFVLIPLTTGICGLTYYAQIIILTAPPHSCLTPLDNNSVSIEENYDESLMIANSTTFDKSSNLSDCHCPNGWEYDYENIFPTLTSENNWVCDDSWKPYTIISFFWLGNTFGAIVYGTLADRYGRRPIIAVSHLLYAICGVASVFVANFTGFLVLRVLQGAGHHTVSHLPFILVVEFCGVKSRVIPLLTVMMSYTIASMLAPGIALLLWDWRIFAIVSSAPAILVVVFYRWLPESPSWLLQSGRKSRALSQLVIMGRINGYTNATRKVSQKIQGMDDETESMVNQKRRNRKAEKSIVAIFKYPILRKNVFLVLAIFMIACFSYYGHTQNTAHLSSNIFLGFFLGALVEIPAWSAPYLINKFGRKLPLAVGFVISGICAVIYVCIPQGYISLSLIFALLGRMFITGGYYITLQYGPEVFPTLIRGQMMALSETLGGVAIFVSPMIVYLGDFYKFLPLTTFGLMSLIGGLTALFLPETVGQVLPQTLQEGNNFKGKQFKLPKCKWRNQSESEVEAR